MAELFVVGSLFFWLLIVAELILLFVFVEYDNGIGATISLLVFGGLLQWCGNTDIIGFVRTNPWPVGGALVAYFLLGAAWGVIKWWLFCKDVAEDYKDKKAEFLRSRGVAASTAVVPENLRADWKLLLSDHYRGKGERTHQPLGKQPMARDHKAMIMRWMTFWVISIIWSFLNDFVKRTFRAIYYKIANFLQRISDNIWQGANADEDLKTPPNNQGR